jgi:hypothetical protein
MLHHPSSSFLPPPPAQLANPTTPSTDAELIVGDEDAELLARCNVALRALGRDIELEKAFSALDQRYSFLEPPYPSLPSLSLTTKMSAEKLRKAMQLSKDSTDAIWRSNMRRQIAAVVEWERECASLRRSIGLTKVARQYVRAMKELRACVAALPSIEAKTIHGVAFKSIIVTSWLSAGYDIGSDLGGELAMSIFTDVRRLASTCATGGTSRRKAAR